MRENEYQPKVGNSVTRHQDGENFVVKKVTGDRVILESRKGGKLFMAWISSFGAPSLRKKKSQNRYRHQGRFDAQLTSLTAVLRAKMALPVRERR